VIDTAKDAQTLMDEISDVARVSMRKEKIPPGKREQIIDDMRAYMVVRLGLVTADERIYAGSE
jgi:hypothetical protein